MKSFILAS